MDQSCGNCRFFLLSDKNSGAGLCRRHPPTVLGGEVHIFEPGLKVPGAPKFIAMIQNIAGQNAPTTRELWCGDFEEAYGKKEDQN